MATMEVDVPVKPISRAVRRVDKVEETLVTNVVARGCGCFENANLLVRNPSCKRCLQSLDGLAEKQTEQRVDEIPVLITEKLELILVERFRETEPHHDVFACGLEMLTYEQTSANGKKKFDS